MNRLLTNNIWQQLKSALPKGKKLAALAYVSTDRYCSFKKGDVLICDASESAIRGGQTSAVTLAKFFGAGAEIYSCENLHAKALRDWFQSSHRFMQSICFVRKCVA
jgi:hypothetical protein